jgi:hypothetical protein
MKMDPKKINWVAVIIGIGLAGCVAGIVGLLIPAPTVSIEKPVPAKDGVRIQATHLYELILPVPTPAQPGETPLERWKRTKKNWEEASHAEGELRDKISRETLPVFETYYEAEKALNETECGKVCVPEAAK